MDSFEDLTIKENRRGDTVVIFEDERLILRDLETLRAQDVLLDWEFPL